MSTNQQNGKSTETFHAIQEQIVKKAKSYIYMIDKRPEMM